MRNKRLNQLEFGVPIFVCILLALFSPLMVYKYNTILGISILLLWIIIALLNKKKWHGSDILSIFYYIYLIVIPYLSGYNFISNRYLVLAIFIMGGVIGSYCDYVDMWDVIGVIIKCISPFLAYVYIKTFLKLRINPSASRRIKSTDEYTIQARMEGIGGYEFIYFLAILSVICFGLFFLLKKNSQKSISLLICVFSYVEIVLSNYMTALLIATIGILLTVIIFLIQKSRIWLIVFILCFIFFLLFGNYFMRLIIDFFLEILPKGGKTFLRLYAMKDSFFNLLFESFLNDRSYTMRQSIKTIWQHPFLGIIGYSGLQKEELLLYIGQHSYFLDTFAFFGCVIGSLSIINYLTIFKKKYFKGRQLVITIPTIVSGFMLLLFNNVSLSIGIAIGIIYPYALHLICKQNKNRVKEEKE